MYVHCSTFYQNGKKKEIYIYGDLIDKPIQMEEEAAQSRVSLSTPNRYTDNTSPDDEATVGLLEDEYSETEKLGLSKTGQGKRRCGLK
jgi:hypothetical protein